MTKRSRNGGGHSLSALLAAVVAASAAYGNTTWHSNPAKNTGSQAAGNAALTDMSYWKDANGNVGSGAPTASDDLIFDNNATSGNNPLRLRLSTVNFAGNSLQIGVRTPGATRWCLTAHRSLVPTRD